MRGADGAATKIQAGFRGYRVRKQLRLAHIKGKRAGTNLGREAQAPSKGETKAAATAAVIEGGAASPAPQDPTAAAADAEAPAASPGAPPQAPDVQLDRFATKIQAGVRGFLVRRQHLHQTRAASTIQATFRAFRARREARLRAAAKL